MLAEGERMLEEQSRNAMDARNYELEDVCWCVCVCVCACLCVCA